MAWWRLRTWLHLSRPLVRTQWCIAFRLDPALTSARHYALQPQLGHAQMAFETMAGFYNDRTPGGFMTAARAERIYRMGK
jgi:hypothetical protein